MDPLTAFAAAGNVLQFVQLGVTLIGEIIEYASDGGSSEYEKMKPVVQQLLVSNAHLSDALAQNSTLPTNPPGPAKAVEQANQQCLEISRGFINFLHSSKLTKPGLSWRSVRSALIALKNKSTLSNYQSRVHEARSNLILSIQVYLVSRPNTVGCLTDTENRILSEMRTVQNASIVITNSIDDLTQQLSSHHINTQDDLGDIKSVLQRQVATFDDLSDRLDRWLGEQPKQVTEISNHLERLQLVFEREKKAVRRQLVESLSFPEIEERRRQIRDAHQYTFEWILQPKERNMGVWNSFVGWLDSFSGQNIYWIRGKPGSGKSTLMRFIDNNVGNQSKSTSSFTQSESLKASCYFWCAGTPRQRSLRGLLQSLLYQIYKARPDLLDRTVPRRRWEEAYSNVIVVEPWNVDDLREALQSVVDETSADSNVFLLIDGLDEYEGTDDQREEMVFFLRQLARSSHVKICLSSRPWNVYKDLFLDTPQLKLEDLTRDDIWKFVQDSLQDNLHFVRLQRRDAPLRNQIDEELVTKANGVFLWVRLAVSNLIKFMRDGGRTSELMDELHSIPDDLDEFFMRMMDGIESRYKGDASMIMQIALCDLNYLEPGSRLDDGQPNPGPTFELEDLYYLSEKTLPDFSLQPDFTVLDRTDKDELSDLLDNLDRRLTSRCMGLLEVDQKLGERPQITFLHRTVRDFLGTPKAQEILCHYTSGKAYHAHRFRCNVLFARLVDMLVTGPWGTVPIDWISCLFQQLRLAQEWNDSVPAFLERLVPLLRPRRGSINTFPRSYLEECLWGWQDREITPLPLAIQLGFNAYVTSRCQQLGLVQAPRPLLDCALRPCHQNPLPPNVELARQLLVMGMDPNSLLGRASILCRFIITLAFIPHVPKLDCMVVLQLLFEHGAALHLKVDEICVAHKLYFRYGLDEGGGSSLLRRIVDNCTLIFLGQNSATGDSWRFSSSIAAYQIFEVLKCIYCEPGKRLLNDDDIEYLEDRFGKSTTSAAWETSRLDDGVEVDDLEARSENSASAKAIDSDHKMTKERSLPPKLIAYASLSRILLRKE